MAHGVGLGKSRTRLGRYLDRRGLTQSWLERHTGISQPTMTRICGDETYMPNAKHRMLIMMVIQNEIDSTLRMDDFWSAD